MTGFALFVRLRAQPGRETAVAEFLAGALPLANAESGIDLLAAKLPGGQADLGAWPTHASIRLDSAVVSWCRHRALHAFRAQRIAGGPLQPRP